jgi:hypothetical protein
MALINKYKMNATDSQIKEKEISKSLATNKIMGV